MIITPVGFADKYWKACCSQLDTAQREIGSILLTKLAGHWNTRR